MTIPVRETFDSVDSRWSICITDDGSPTLVDRELGDSMHSGCGALAETEHVYLRNSGISDRLEQRFPSRVLEVGLGTGLGCLLTAMLANRLQTPVDYVALENKLTPVAVVEQLRFDQQGIEPALVDDYCRVIALAGNETVAKGCLGKYGLLSIYQSDAVAWDGNGEAAFDAVYFDPYSPSTNPDLWTASVLQRMYNLLSPNGRLVSYCVNRQVRDTLSEVGFHVTRVPGPVGGKREVLVAHKLPLA
jgi:tRNA U34 5-methylaminomethyl-2-thiouridine-forming methyltransferase MnmC